MAKHRAARQRRAAMAGVATVASVGALLAGTAGVAVSAVGTTAPAPKDCTDAISALVAARVGGSNDRHDAVDKRQHANADGQSVRDAEAALATAKSNRAAAQKAWDEAAPADKPAKLVELDKAKASEQEAGHDRDAAVAKHERSNVVALDAEVRWKHSNTAIVELEVTVGRLCKDAAAPPEVIERKPAAAPVPSPVESHLPVTH